MPWYYLIDKDGKIADGITIGVKGHRDDRRLELGYHADTQSLEQRDALFVAQQGAASFAPAGVQAPSCIEVAVRTNCCRLISIHLAAQGLEFRQRDITGATPGRGSR